MVFKTATYLNEFQFSHTRFAGFRLCFLNIYERKHQIWQSEQNFEIIPMVNIISLQPFWKVVFYTILKRCFNLPNLPGFLSQYLFVSDLVLDVEQLCCGKHQPHTLLGYDTEDLDGILDPLHFHSF